MSHHVFSLVIKIINYRLSLVFFDVCNILLAGQDNVNIICKRYNAVKAIHLILCISSHATISL